MANYNKVLLIGNLTRDPEVRYTPKGTAVCELDLAINRIWNDDQGQQREEVTYVNNIEVWGRQAETAGKYLSKGRPVLVEGRLRLDTWEDKDTKQKRSRLRVVAERIQFLGAPRNAEFEGGGEAGDSGGGAPRRSAARAASPRPAAAEEPASPPEEPPKDDIPF